MFHFNWYGRHHFIYQKLFLIHFCNIIVVSHSYRVASLEGGVDELPCSLVLLNSGGAVVGHARLLPVAGATNAALIESGTSNTTCAKFTV